MTQSWEGIPRFLEPIKKRTGEFYWNGMKYDGKYYVDKCSVSQCNKAQTLTVVSLLKKLPNLERFWEDISLVFVEGLQKSYSSMQP